MRISFKGEKGVFMFGYVVVNKPELKIKDFDTYQAFYCGVCRFLHTDYGRIGQLSLNYDVTFLAILLTGLYEPETKTINERCIIHPIIKHEKLSNTYLAYAADMTILLTYLKMEDDWKDDHQYRSLCKRQLLRKKFQFVQEKYPEKTHRIIEALKQTEDLEINKEYNIDKLSSLTGILMGEIMSYTDDTWRSTLYDVGDYLGRFIYIMDAYEDIEEDIKKQNFNPFMNEYKQDNFDERIKHILEILIAKSADAFEILPILKHVDILRNIMYSGVWDRYEMIRKKRLGEKNG